MNRRASRTPHALRASPSAVALAIACAFPAAWAQEAAAPAAAAASAPPRMQLETIVVTAQKRAEPLQSVPVSDKAFSATQITDAGIRTTQDFIGMVPNVGFENSYTYANSFVSIRGINQINNGDSPVAVVVDGVPQANQKQLKMNLFDVQRIEVLKGPQGALYGRNAIGGAIVIDTKRPTNKLEGFADVDFSNGNRREFTGGVSGAIVDDRVLFRVVGQALKSDGLIGNDYLHRNADFIHHDDSLRGKLLIRATDDVEIDLRASVNSFSAGAIWDSMVRDAGPDTIRPPISNMLGSTLGRTTDLSAKIDWDTSLGEFTAITGLTRLKEDNRGDLDFTNPTDPGVGALGDPALFDLPEGTQFGQGQNLSTRMLSQELRWTSPDNRPVRWIAGAYVLSTRRALDSRAFIDADGQNSQFDDPDLQLFSFNEFDRNLASAGFGQVDVDITSQTTLTGALRHDQDRRRQTDLSTGDVRAATFSDWQPKLNLTQKFTPTELGYLTASTGFRSGGFNSPGDGNFAPETLRNFEAGLKSTLLDKRLYLNVALFMADSKNYQYFHLDADSAQLIDNIDRVRMHGLDLDFNWLAAARLEIDGGLGVTISRILRNSAEPDTAGNYTPNATPWKLTLGAQYEWPVAAAINGFVRADEEHRSKKYWDPDNVATTRPVDLVALRLGLRAPNDRWSATLSGRNLLDARYYSDFGSAKYFGSPEGVNTGSLAPPRTWGLEAMLRF
jgi:iron complex outermembrane receptor protein